MSKVVCKVKGTTRELQSSSLDFSHNPSKIDLIVLLYIPYPFPSCSFIWLASSFILGIVDCFIRTWLLSLLPQRLKKPRSISSYIYLFHACLTRAMPATSIYKTLSRIYQVLCMGLNAFTLPLRQVLRYANCRAHSRAEIERSRLHCLRQCRSCHNRTGGIHSPPPGHWGCPFNWISPLSSLSTPTLATPSPMQPNAFPNWEQDLFIPEAPISLSLEQLPEVVVEEGLGQREVDEEEDLVFRARECYQTPTPIPRRCGQYKVYWPQVDLQCQDILYNDNFTPYLCMWAYLQTLYCYPY